MLSPFPIDLLPHNNGGLPVLWIVCILIGFTFGQKIKLTVSPELLVFFRSIWALAHEKTPVIKGSATVAAKRIKGRTAQAPKLKASEV